MDLAELRQKAKKEQKGENGVTDAPVAIPAETTQESVEPIQADRGALPDIPDELCQETVEPPVAKASETLPENFDPLAILMAGRADLHADDAEPDHAGATSYATGEEFQEFLCFRVSAEIYAINIMAIKEIIRPREVTDIPRAPGFVSGILSLRGIIIPIFNMRLRLGLPEGEKSGRQRIIVVKKGEEFIGIIVDEVTQVVRIATASIEKPPAVLDGIDRDFVNGIGRYNGQMLILLNQEKILDISLGQGGERGRV
jgi:purine-binding chemotaxis protein CheW